MLVCAQAVGSRLLARSAAAERATEYMGYVFVGSEMQNIDGEAKQQGAWMRGQTHWGAVGGFVVGLKSDWVGGG